jgi:ligand-binding sensor domain-containing protein
MRSNLKPLKKFAWLVIWILLFADLRAQEPFFRNIIDNSLINEAQINCTFQDHQGFIWIGTSSGLFRYDGIELNSALESEQTYLSGVSAIGEDSLHHIWIGLENGLILLRKQNNPIQIMEVDSFPKAKITKIIKGKNNRMWFGTYGDGLYFTNGRELKRFDRDDIDLTDKYIYDIEKSVNDDLWLGTDNGIHIIRETKTGYTIKNLSIDDGLPDFIVQCIKRDMYDNMWIGMHEHGVCTYDIQSGEFIIPEQLRNWSNGPINDILPMNDQVWIATDGKGLYTCTIRDETLRLFTGSENAGLMRIKKMLLDKEGNVWLASHTHVSVSLGNKLAFIKGFGTRDISNVHALITGTNGAIWFGNDQGLFRYRPQRKNEPAGLKSFPIGLNFDRQKIMSLYRDHFGFIWIGTFGQGVIRLDPGSGAFVRYTEKDGLVNANILSIDGNSQEIWFATLGGASRIKIDNGFGGLDYVPEFENFGKQDGLSNNFIYDIDLDQHGTVWFATDGSGVITYRDGHFQPLTTDSSFNNKVVYSVVSDADRHIWMNVASEGLYRYDGEHIVKYFNDPDHKSLSFSGILANRNNELIITYDDGMDVLNTRSGNIIHFEGNAGMGNIKPDLNTLAMDKDGRIWVGTTPFIVCYDPVDSNYWNQPQTVIREVSLFLETIDTATRHQFNHDENHFSFDYTGFWFQYPEKVFYSVKLDGHDLDWMRTKNNSVIYSNLSPGNYTFRVRSGLYNNFSNATEATYTFQIRKPFWSTLWFLFLALLVLAGVVVLYIKIRERNIRRKQEIIRDRIMFQYENLKSQINPHFLFNSFSTLIALIETEPETAIDYVSELSVLFRNVLEYKEKETITLEEELNIVDNYIRLQKKRYGDNLKIQMMDLDTIKSSKIPPLTLQLLIENALKHNVVSRDRPLTINIYADLSKGYIFVKNNLQLKKEVMVSTGIGIETIISRYRILTVKSIIIDKNEETFTLGIPLLIAKDEGINH